jgi:dUTP pyrophosphatase
LLIPTGLQVAYIEPGYEIQIRPRSGLAYKNGLTVLNTPGTIDNPYRGHLCVILINHDIMFHEISHGDRIAQIVVCPVVTAKFSVVDDIVLTERSDGGFGHTGME